MADLESVEGRLALLEETMRMAAREATGNSGNGGVHHAVVGCWVREMERIRAMVRGGGPGGPHEFLVATTEEGGASYDAADLEGIARILSSDGQPQDVVKPAVGWGVLAKVGTAWWWPNGVIVRVLSGVASKPNGPWPRGLNPTVRRCEGCNYPLPESHPAVYCNTSCALRDA